MLYTQDFHQKSAQNTQPCRHYSPQDCPCDCQWQHDHFPEQHECQIDHQPGLQDHWTLRQRWQVTVLALHHSTYPYSDHDHKYMLRPYSPAQVHQRSGDRLPKTPTSQTNCCCQGLTERSSHHRLHHRQQLPSCLHSHV